MNSSLTNWANVSLILSGFGTFLALLIGGFAYVIRHTVDKKFSQDVKPVLDELTTAVKELKANGGKSIKDVVDKTWEATQTITERQIRLVTRIEELEKKKH